MRRLLFLLALLLAGPAFAQATYPTVAGSRVNGVVPLQCDVNGANCAPAGSASPSLVAPSANTSAAVSASTATTTQIVAASGSTVIYVKNWVLVTTLANNVTWKSGDTGGACANAVALTGAMPFGANGGASVGGGFGDVLVLPAGKALCLTTSAATQISGSVAYRQQ